MRKTTVEDFEIFKKVFMKWAERLNCLDWRVDFSHEEVDCNAQVDFNNMQLVSVSLGLEIDDWQTPEICAKHEAIHLLLARLCVPACSRNSTVEEVDRAIESVVRVLERRL